MSYRRSTLRLLIILLALFSPFGISAQNYTTYVPTVQDNLPTTLDPIGVPPQASATGTHEAVNLSNGGLSVFLPVLSVPQRGGWNITLGYTHNSMAWAPEQEVAVYPSVYGSNGINLYGDNYIYNISMIQKSPGWQINLPRLRASYEYVGDMAVLDANGTQTQTVPVFCVNNWTFTDWSGNSHPFEAVASCNAQLGEGRLPPLATITPVVDSTDGSWLRIDTSNLSDIVIRTKDGTAYHFTDFVNPFAGCSPCTVNQNSERFYQGTFSSMADSNGNTVTYAKGTGTLADTIGRSITIGSGGISYKDSNGNPQTISLTTTSSSTLAYSFPSMGCSYSGPPFKPPVFASPTVNCPAQTLNLAPFTVDLLFPAADSTGTPRKFHLQFDGLSRITQIIYPSGGYTRYDYQNYSGQQQMGQVHCATIVVGEVAHKYECPSSSGVCSPELTTTYTPVAGGGVPYNASIDETDPTGAHSHHVFSNFAQYPQISPRETDTYSYNSGGTLLRTVHTDFTPYVNGVDLALPSTITTTLNDISPALSSK